MQAKYETVNLKPSAYIQLKELAELLSTPYAKVNLGQLVAQLIAEKYTTINTTTTN